MNGARASRRMFKKADGLTRPAPARQDAPFRGRGRSEVRDAKNNERHVCGRARVGERPVSLRRSVYYLHPPTHRLQEQAFSQTVR
jgi:hypothetical protein